MGQIEESARLRGRLQPIQGIAEHLGLKGASPGGPTVAPLGNLTITARGYITRSTRSRRLAMATVGIPAASMARCINPPD